MAKVQQKSEKITAFGGIFFVLDRFDRILSSDVTGDSPLSHFEKAKYEGWREVIPGKHPETAYFAYFSRELGAKAYLCVRRIKNTGLFKPYAIIDQTMFDAEIQNLRK